MPTRSLKTGGKTWDVFPSGFVTQYDRDEFGLIFVSNDGGKREVRTTRFSPQGTRSREQALAEMPDEKLRELFEQSQPSFTSPEAGYVPSGPGSDRKS
jgi:hypothetical protein